MKNTITSILLCLIVLSCKNPEKLSNHDTFNNFIITGDSINTQFTILNKENKLGKAINSTSLLIEKQLTATLHQLKSTNQSDTFKKFTKDLSSFNMVVSSFDDYFIILSNYRSSSQLLGIHSNNENFVNKMNSTFNENLNMTDDNIKIILQALTDESIDMRYTERLNLIISTSEKLKRTRQKTEKLKLSTEKLYGIK